MKLPPISLLFCALALGGVTSTPSRSQDEHDFSPRADERQLPKKMRSAMSELPVINVGWREGNLVGGDQAALQAAVDYVGSLGGGTVVIGPGIYLMNDSLHLRSHVRVEGTPDETILRKAPSVVTSLALDGDFGEEQVTLKDPQGFRPGYGVAVWDNRSGGFHTTVARIVAKEENRIALDLPLNADCMVHEEAKAATVFPVVSGVNIEGAHVEGLTIDGNKSQNIHLNGCRGAGIYLYRGFGTVIRNCRVRDYHGDGISFQQSNDVVVENCVSENNANLGIHPGSGSQRAIVRDCRAIGNGEDGLFLCWRVRHGVFENNRLEGNGRFGISIGHKDSDNLIANNQVRANDRDGIFFRNETLGMAGHRNRLEGNLIENNGREGPVAGIRVRGETKDLILKNNTIRDTREAADRRQTSGILLEEKVGAVVMEGNEVDAGQELVDERASAEVEGPR